MESCCKPILGLMMKRKMRLCQSVSEQEVKTILQFCFVLYELRNAQS
jgi:hypothetical protein